MIRLPIQQRENWQQTAREYGFKFHTMYGEPYWDESAYYQFSLQQIERDLEDPSEELHQMCLQVVDKVIKDDYYLKLFQIPKSYWDYIAQSWHDHSPSLYARLDLVYDGKSPAKLLENNADTPTSLYETGFWQWLWLEHQVDAGKLSRQADQFNSLQEKLVNRFVELAEFHQTGFMHFACCEDTEEDRGTVQYLQDCAAEAGLNHRFVHIEQIGVTETGQFADLQQDQINHIFKLYPWEFMLNEDFAESILTSNTQWIEPPWKTILSNKALLPMLWKLFPNHPNLLPAWFEHELHLAPENQSIVKKPLFSREGANISILASKTEQGSPLTTTDGPYGEEGYIYQQTQHLPQFAGNHTLIGSWIVGDQPAGISVREDSSPITQDLSRFLPHICVA
jgi:glutathionylspermidine synthase